MADKTSPDVQAGLHDTAPAPSSPFEFYGNNNVSAPQTQSHAPGHGGQHYYYGHASSMASGAPGYGPPQPPPNMYPGYGPPPTHLVYGAPMHHGPPQAMSAPPAAAAAATTPPKLGKPKICGVPRAIFWIIVASTSILFLGGLGAGLGVGLSNFHKPNSGSGSSADSDNVPSRTLDLSPTFTDDPDDPTTEPTRSHSDTEPTTTAAPTPNFAPTGTATSANIQCPRDDHTSYFTSGSSTGFTILCNTYLPGTFSESTAQSNMGACIQACHNDSVCTGVLYWFSTSITLNCDMYYELEVSDAGISDTDYAFGAYEWALDTIR